MRKSLSYTLSKLGSLFGTLCMALTLRITYLFIPDVRLPQHLGLFARRSVVADERNEAHIRASESLMYVLCESQMGKRSALPAKGPSRVEVSCEGGWAEPRRSL